MTRTVRSFLPIPGDASALARAFEDDPVRWLPGARREHRDRLSVHVRAGSWSRSVTARVGATWRAGNTRWRSLAWDPAGDDAPVDRLLPALDGELGLHVEPRGRVTLVLDARYQPPGGGLGDAIDAVALHRVATSTVEHFLTDVAARLSAEALLRETSPPRNPPAHHRASAVGT